MSANLRKTWRAAGLILASVLAASLLACDPLGDDDDDAVFGRIVGASQAGFVDGAHNVARFSNPANVEVASNGTVYVADFDNDAVRTIAPDGTVGTLVAMPANSRPFGLTIAPDGFLYVQTDGNAAGVRDDTTGTLWRVSRTTGVATQIATGLGRPRGLQALPDGRIAMSDPAHHVITLIDPAATVPTETLLAGANDTTGTTDATGAAARFNRPYGLALLPNGSLLVADQGNDRLREVTLAGVVTTFAGSTQGSANGPIATATFNAPQDVAIAGLNIYVADHDNFLIRRISGSTVFTQAGNGMQGFADGEGSAASFYGLEGIALDASGSTLWIADGNNGDGSDFNRVRRLNVP